MYNESVQWYFDRFVKAFNYHNEALQESDKRIVFELDSYKPGNIVLYKITDQNGHDYSPRLVAHDFKIYLDAMTETVRLIKHDMLYRK